MIESGKVLLSWWMSAEDNIIYRCRTMTQAWITVSMHKTFIEQLHSTVKHWLKWCVDIRWLISVRKIKNRRKHGVHWSLMKCQVLFPIVWSRLRIQLMGYQCNQDQLAHSVIFRVFCQFPVTPWLLLYSAVVIKSMLGMVLAPSEVFLCILRCNWIFFKFSPNDGMGRCNEGTVAGGNIPDDRIISIGRSQFAIRFFYQTYIVPDEIQVYYEDNQVFTSTCIGTTLEQSTIIFLNANASSLRVKVIPNCQGNPNTAWRYAIECPGRISCDDGQCTCGKDGLTSTQVQTPIPNQCGAKGGSLNWYIESLGVAWGFTPACNDHDICYGTCGLSKFGCDLSFLVSARRLCNQNWSNTLNYQVCLERARMFYAAIHWFGNAAYEKGQKEDCVCF